MLYFANPCTPAVVESMRRGELGYITTPIQRNTRPAGVAWCADNGCFGKGYPGDEAWLAWLRDQAKNSPETCVFAVAPDVVGDAVATLERSAPWLAEIRALGLPAALVAQNGLESLDIPWDTFDVLFIGGTTEWKLGRHARDITRQAKTHSKAVHMGRVNTRRRWRYAEHIGCDSVDGTLLTFGPDIHLPRLLAWQQPALTFIERNPAS